MSRCRHISVFRLPARRGSRREGSRRSEWLSLAGLQQELEAAEILRPGVAGERNDGSHRLEPRVTKLQRDGSAFVAVAQLEEHLRVLPIRRDLIRRPGDRFARIQLLYPERHRARSKGELVDAAHLGLRLGVRPPSRETLVGRKRFEQFLWSRFNVEAVNDVHGSPPLRWLAAHLARL